MVCERCGKTYVEVEPIGEEKFCDDCLHEMLMPGGSSGFDWGHWDFERGEYKK